MRLRFELSRTLCRVCSNYWGEKLYARPTVYQAAMNIQELLQKFYETGLSLWHYQ